MHALDKLSWDNLRLLLAVADAGSFRAVASTAGVSLNTIRTKIERLERQIGGVLLKRSVEGVQLTQDGSELASIAREMRALGRSAERVQRGAQAQRNTQVRITATEGIGTFWLVPRLVDFQIANPDVRIDLTCDMAPPDVLFRDTDIAIQLTRPTSPDLMVQRIATLHLMPFAAESYLRVHGVPESLADAAQHRLVWQVADQVESDLLPLFIDSGLAEHLISVQTNTSSSHFGAIARGAGIGFLPTYVRALSRSVRPIDIGVCLRRDVFLVHHADSVRFPEVRRALDWLRGAFDKEQFPWFADEFVHPNEFETRFNDNAIINLFEGYIAALPGGD